MAESGTRLVQLAYKISDVYNVERPKSNDIGDWWERALQQMDDADVIVWGEAFNFPSEGIVGRMKRILEARIAQIKNPA